MRHRRRGRRFRRTSSHVKAMLRNLASSLFLTERESVDDEENKPKVKGRVITTLQKAKEVRPLVEKCITLARHSLPYAREAEQFATTAKRYSDEWRQWRTSDRWQQWCGARASVVAARRRALQLLGDKQAVEILFAEVAPRFAQRQGGYTRVLKLAKPRLGDSGARAILEFVGVHDRVAVASEKPSFSDADRLPSQEKTTAAPEPQSTADSVPASSQESPEGQTPEQSNA